MIKFLLIAFFLVVSLNKIESSYDCRLLADIDIRLNASDFKPFDTTFSKCGLVPGQFLSNKIKHGVFYISWHFTSMHSFKLNFTLENIENISILNYHYSYRKFTSADEIATNVTKFEKVNELSKSSYSYNSSNHMENSLVFNYDPIPESLESSYELLKYMYVICVMIVNLKEGTVFTMPFMCIDVYVDENYYKSLKNHSEDLHYGIVITLSPLAILFLVIISVVYHRFYSKKPSTQTLSRLIEMTRNNLLAVDLLKKIETSGNNARRFSRYELYEDCMQLQSNDDLLLNELKTCINNTTDNNNNNKLKYPIKTLAKEKRELEEFYV